MKPIDRRVWVPFLALMCSLACEQRELTMPSVDDVEEAYVTDRPTEARISGNVVELTVYQPSRQLHRGGTLWAKVGPYVYLFSEPTRDLFERHLGVAGVRVVTRAPGGEEVAQALLRRDALNEVMWQRALNIAGKARRDGTERVTLLQDLVSWGERHTTYEYAPAYMRSR